MKSDKQIQKDVRLAVKEYVDELITQRTGPGKGMAVTANDLMLAAKSAGQKSMKYDASKMMEDFAQTGIKLIQHTPNGATSPKIRLQGSKLTYSPLLKHKPKNTNNTTTNANKRESHWLTWSTGETPTPPSTPVVRPQSRVETPAQNIVVNKGVDNARPASSRPTSARPPSVRPVSARPPSCRPTSARPPSCRPTSARPPSVRPISARPECNEQLDFETPIARPASASPNITKANGQRLNLAIRPASRTPIPPATPAVSDISLPQYFAPMPEPLEEYPATVASIYNVHSSARPHSAIYQTTMKKYRSPSPAALSERSATPAELQSVYRDVLASEHPTSAAHYRSNVPGGSVNPAFVPALQSWVTNANDYERDVAYSLFQALGGKAPNAHTKPIRPRPKSAVVKIRAYKSERQAAPAGVQTSENAWEAYRKAMMMCNGQNLALTGQSLNMQSPQFNSRKPRPSSSKYNRKVFPPTEYTCETSFFLNSMVPFKREFTINPEWASEHTKAANTNFQIRQSLQHQKGTRF